MATWVAPDSNISTPQFEAAESERGIKRNVSEPSTANEGDLERALALTPMPEPESPSKKQRLENVAKLVFPFAADWFRAWLPSELWRTCLETLR